ncbi:acyl-CoA dehydrogenase family protein [Amycolatopsis sp. NPDC005003]
MTEPASLQPLRFAVRKFVREQVVPYAEDWEADRRFPRELLADLGDRGFLAAADGADPGAELWQQVVLTEELAASGYLGLTLSVGIHAAVCLPALAGLAGGTPEPAAAAGQAARGRVLLGLALTEPSGGSSLRTRTTLATRRGGDYVLNGEKIFITNAPIADHLLVLAATDPERNHRGLSLFFVPATTPGFSVKETMALDGLRSSPTGRVVFEDCVVPERFLLGKRGLGFTYAQRYAGYERLFGGIGCVAFAEMVLDKTIERLRTRQLDGVPLARHQAVRHRIGELSAGLEAGRQLGYAAVRLLAGRRRAHREIAMTKLLTTETAQEVVAQCAQWHGGYGFLADHLVARAMRDVRMATVGGGPSEVMKEIVAAYRGV